MTGSAHNTLQDSSVAVPTVVEASGIEPFPRTLLLLSVGSNPMLTHCAVLQLNTLEIVSSLLQGGGP